MAKQEKSKAENPDIEKQADEIAKTAQSEVRAEKEREEIEEVPETVDKKPASDLREKKLVSSASFWPFQKNSVFIGTYIDEFFTDEGEMIGYRMEDDNGKEWLVPNSHAIKKGFNQEFDTGMGESATVKSIGARVKIEFLGQIKTSDGKPYNQFEVKLW